MKIACLSFTHNGGEIGKKILTSYNMEQLYIEEVHLYENSQVQGGIRSILEKIVREYDGIVFISATGIAVRMIAPYIKNKIHDPAVVVVDDMGRYAISLLSGHIGGANELSENIASIIGAQPIITTASDGRGIESVDMFAKRLDLYIESMNEAKELTSMMVNGKKIGFCSEVKGNIDYENLVHVDFRDIHISAKDIEGIVCVTSNQKVDVNQPCCLLRPKNLNIGIGCRKGIEGQRVIDAIYKVLNENNLSEKSIRTISTVEIKKDEKGILAAAEHFNCPMKIYTLEEIKRVEDKFEKSEFVKENVGVYSVCEPCCYLTGGDIVVKKTKINGITVAISKEAFYG